MDGDTYDPIVKRFGPKMKVTLERVRTSLLTRQFAVTSIAEHYNDTYSVDMRLVVNGTLETVGDKDIYLSIELLDKADIDGDEDEDGNILPGINFRLDIVENGGRQIGGMTPFNYSDECWVDATSQEAMDARWTLFDEALKPEDVVATLDEDSRQNALRA